MIGLQNHPTEIVLFLFSFLGKFGPVMQEHIRRIKNNVIHDHQYYTKIDTEVSI